MLIVGETVQEAPFQATRNDFTDFNGDISVSFNWPGIFDYFGITSEETSIVVAYHRQQLEGVNKVEINRLDHRILGGARKSGGLIDYKSYENPEDPLVGVNVCMWKDMMTMMRETRSKTHVEAVRRAPEFYKKYRLVCWEATRRTVTEQVDFTKLYEHSWPKKQLL